MKRYQSHAQRISDWAVLSMPISADSVEVAVKVRGRWASFNRRGKFAFRRQK